MAEGIQRNFTPFKKGQMVWLECEESETGPGKMETDSEKRRTLQDC
jgi:hypothetical protein